MGRENPIVGPNTVAELRAYVANPDLPTATQGQVYTMLAKLALATAAPKVSDAEAHERLELYWLALKDLPVEDLRVAFVELVRTAKFLPTPSEVREAALKVGHPRRRALVRAKHLIFLHERHWQPPPSDIVDPAEVRAFLDQHAASMRRKDDEATTEEGPTDAE